jgi:hypothetical protein
MEAYTEEIAVASLKPAGIYKVTTTKSAFLAKYQGKNKNDQLHFIDQETNRLVVLTPTDHIVSVHATK